MKIVKEIRTYCPKCNKHTQHTVRLYSGKAERGQSMGKRRNIRKRKGYFGKVKGIATHIKVAKRQKVLLECKECKYVVERVIGTRTKKKLEIKAM
ncbi:MAG: 50S ribosomal protein L44e [Candidatus Marsarchaeota archaeon]|jgi:large subunit ribosomal protein L44e|nr:50S ribosomal protein L44e [Candidatus Marsarchaeota archaeon]MCL5115323.1 50S ribosomal protein L44e [Candidatus Marsarchaeota archaeon]